MISFCLGLLLAGFARAGVTVSVSTTTAELAKPVEASARAPGAKLELDLARSTTDSFAIGKVEASADGSVRLQILPLSIGKLSVPLFWNVTEGGKTESEASAPLVLDVAGPAVGPTTQIEDIRSPLRASRRWWPWLLALLVAAAAGWWAHRRLGEKEGELAQAPPPDPRPADVIALEALAALRASALWSERRYKEFYAALTDVLRQYLERRYEIPATRLTTAELLRHLKQSEVERSAVMTIKGVFDRADLVKFAKLSPEDSWGPSDLDSAAGAVQATRPAPPAPAQEAAA